MGWNSDSTIAPARHAAPLLFSLGLAALSPLVAALPAHACSTCGCTLNADWVSQGYDFGSGFNLALRFDYIDQSRLREGTGSVDLGAITFPNEREIQKRTISRAFTFDLGYSPTPDWSVTLSIPAIDRTHATVAEGDTLPSYSRSAGVGDVRVLGRYQGLSRDRSFGVMLGFKLPTGRIGDTFSDGPQAGAPVDRGLQLGTGTTDLLAGAFKFGTVAPDWGYFGQLIVDIPLDSSDGFRPGDSLTASTGVRYTGWGAFVPQAQFDLRAEKPEKGIDADSANSGATLAYFSPGFTLEVRRRLQLFVFLQLPVYQRVTGYQLEPDVLVSVGLHVRF